MFFCSCGHAHTSQSPSNILSHLSSNSSSSSYICAGKKSDISNANQFYFFLEVNPSFHEDINTIIEEILYIDVFFDIVHLFQTDDFVADFLEPNFVAFIVTISDDMLDFPFSCDKIRLNGDDTLVYDIGTITIEPKNLSDSTVYINYSPYYFIEPCNINEEYSVDYHLITFNGKEPSTIRCGDESLNCNLKIINLVFSYSDEITNQSRHDLIQLGASYTIEELNSMKVYIITMVFQIKSEENIIFKPYFDIAFDDFVVTTIPPTPLVILY